MKIGRLDGFRFAETQMGYRDTAGFFRVVLEVSLRVHVRMVADDFNGIFIGAHRTVRTEAKEFAAEKCLRERSRLLSFISRLDARLKSSSSMPTVKWFLGEGARKVFVNTAFTMDGVKSLDPRAHNGRRSTWMPVRPVSEQRRDDILHTGARPCAAGFLRAV